MMSNNRIILITSFALVLALAGAAGLWALMDGGGAGGRHDGERTHHQDVLNYRGPHKLLPFDRILLKLRQRISGEIIKTEFEIEDGVPVYEIKYIRDDGQVMELYVDARSGAVLKEEQD